ncbi:MAG: helix-turn-helix domain-containing protein [Lachnospiraceae bacterium]|nr:helix-turn-helix domain-containing protein [Lachnospiraceae bacterium]
MSKLFDDLYTGLNQAIDYAKGKNNSQAKAVTLVRYSIDPVEEYDRNQIRNIRMGAKMSQAVFADYLGVSVKTVEAWECGRTHPTGPACRLISLVSGGQAPSLPFIRKEA